MKWLNYHTHTSGSERYTDDDGVIIVQSLQYGEEAHQRADYATIGLHPMFESSKKFLGISNEHGKQRLKDVILQSSIPIIAIGECGWDKRSTMSETQQMHLIELQVMVAKELKLPMVVHVVGYWHLLLWAQKAYPSVTWIVHGFRGNSRLSTQLRHADIHLSLHPNHVIHGGELPDKFLLETDDTDADIRELYHIVAEKERVSELDIKRNTINYFYTLHSL